MHIIAYLVTLGLVLISDVALAIPLVSSHAVPRSFQKHRFSRRDLDVFTIQQELGPLLFNSSSIFGPDSCKWAAATKRFNVFSRPNVEVVVVPGIEADVSTIVSVDG